jgi:hypothetical protein
MVEDSIDATYAAEPGDRPGATEPAGLEVAREKRSDGRSAWLVAAAVAVFLALGFVLFRSTGQDDSYISYWPAHTLAKYGSIINYNGDRVEQSSSLLWVLMLGGLTFLTRVPVPLLGPLLSIAGGALAVVVASRLAARLDRRMHGYAALLTATATYLIYGSVSGMETSLVGVCTAWLAVTYSDYLTGLRARKLEILAATLCCVLVRPELGAVLCVLLAGLMGVLWVRRRRGLLEADAFAGLTTRIGLLALVVVGISIGLAAARIGYFHSPVPEPALVKGGRQSHIPQGLHYLVLWSMSFFVLPTVCLTLLGIALTLKEAVGARPLNMTRLVCTLLLIAYGCFIVWVGGDWMLAGRFIAHVLPVALVLAADTLGRLTPPRLLPAVGLTMVVIQLCGVVRYAGKNSVGTAPWSPLRGVDRQVVSGLSWFERTDRLFLRDAPVALAVDRVVARMVAAGHPVAHIFSGQMGLVMYKLASRRFGQIDVTDRHGLADRRLVSCPLAAGRARLTNGLSVDYVWFLTHRGELERDCKVPSPDIIYDIDSARSQSRARAIRKNGYALVYHLICDVPKNRGWLPGDQVQLDECIAVRRDLLTHLGLRELSADQFTDATL